MCGEKPSQLTTVSPRKGSPPRVRGKECPMPDLRLGAGITPACAGKRVRADRQWHKDRDHPRVCGEKVSSAALMMIVAGSPPRVRGKAVAAYNSVAAEGITPACAGKSTLRKTAGSTYRDHPRVCGEKAAERAEVGKGRGSPPRVRGKVIPPLVVSPLTGDHPRVCGEKVVQLRPISQRVGSPPRVRGKGVENSGNLCLTRITPACAGKSGS